MMPGQNNFPALTFHAGPVLEAEGESGPLLARTYISPTPELDNAALANIAALLEQDRATRMLMGPGTVNLDERYGWPTPTPEEAAAARERAAQRVPNSIRDLNMVLHNVQVQFGPPTSIEVKEYGETEMTLGDGSVLTYWCDEEGYWGWNREKND